MQNWFKRIYQILIIIGLLSLVVRLADSGVRRSRALPVLPQPNGYDELVIAAREIKSPSSELAELNRDEVRQLAEDNKPVLEKARRAMVAGCGVPLETTKGWQDRHAQDLRDFKRLAVAFAVEAKAHLQAGRNNQAAGCQLEIVRLAKSVGRGGILVDGVTSLTLEVIGVATLQSMLPQLDGAFCREAALTLEKLQAEGVNPETIIATEQAWSRRQFGLTDVVGGRLRRKELAKRYAEFSKKADEVAERAQRLTLRLAARGYQLEEEHPPTTVADLVPKFLKTLPVDKATGKPIQDIPAPMQ